jgi:hypothetical protein
VDRLVIIVHGKRFCQSAFKKIYLIGNDCLA